jgi:antiphage defense system Thoeris ThsB-like protein
MMPRKIFVSYNFRKDAHLAHNIKTFFQPQGRCDGTPVFVENVSAQGDDAIDREINRVMEGCDAAVFVVGDDSHNSPWINREAELARSKPLGIVTVRAPGTTGGLPNVLRGSPEPVDWGHDELCQALNRIPNRT